MAAKMCSTLKTYGPKPKTFKLSDGDDLYMLGSEVGNYLRLFRGDLYKKYPGLSKRKMVGEERKLAGEQIGYGYNNISTNVQIIKVTEVEDMLAGNDDKYRSAVGYDSSSRSFPEKGSNAQSGNSRSSKKNTWTSQLPSTSFHLDAVPCATPITHYKTNNKKVKSFPTWYNMDYLYVHTFECHSFV